VLSAASVRVRIKGSSNGNAEHDDFRQSVAIAALLQQHTPETGNGQQAVGLTGCEMIGPLDDSLLVAKPHLFGRVSVKILLPQAEFHAVLLEEPAEIQMS